MGRTVAFRVLLVGLLTTLLLCSPVIAQDTPPAAPEGQVELPEPTEEIPFVAPFGMVTELPYARWTRHVGTPEEAAVLIQVQGQGATRAATGFVMRCDGFILVPSWVTEAMKEGARLSVSVTAAEGENLTVPLPVLARTHHATRRALYGVIKVTGYHLRCLPLLDPGNIRPGTPVRLVTAQEGKAAWQCEATSVPATIGSLGEKKDQWTLAARPDQPLSLATSAPVGAIVVDEESGAALGIVTQSGDSPVFASFLYFHDLSKDMALVPNREILKERKKRPQNLSPEELGRLKPLAEKGFAWVPGGPVRLSGKTAIAYQRAYRTDIACTPGFFVSASLVTNAEYRQWLLLQPVPHRPSGWERPDELVTPRRNPLLPVVGVSQEDAMVYAAAHNGRLLTEVEWSRAALCRDTTWVGPILTNWQRGINNMRRLMDLRVHIMRYRVEAGRAKKSASEEFQTAVEGANLPSLQENTTSLLLEVQNMTRVTGGMYPPIVTPVGYRKDDVSIFGVRDVIMNAAEIVLGIFREIPQNKASKAFPAPTDPNLAIIRFTRTNEVTGQAEPYVMTVSDTQAILQTSNLQPEDRIFLTYHSIMASAGYRVQETIVGSSTQSRNGRTETRTINDAISIESGPLYPPGFRIAQ